MYVGVQGSATRSIAVLADEEGSILAVTASVGMTSHLHKEQVSWRLAGLMSRLAAAAGMNEADLARRTTRLCLAMSGAWHEDDKGDVRLQANRAGWGPRQASNHVGDGELVLLVVDDTEAALVGGGCLPSTTFPFGDD